MAVGWPSTPPIGAVDAVPTFVSWLIEDGKLSKSRGGLSFVEIVACLKANRFEIMAGVDSDEVSAFVRVERGKVINEATADLCIP
jgi:hypothetical protein